MHWLARGLDDVPSGLDWLSVREQERYHAMRFAKRRTEFLVSRYTAKLALARRLGRGSDPASLARLELARKPTGAPLAVLDGQPAPVAVSQTDRADWAVCVVLGPPGELRVGCDLELVEPRSAGFVRDYLTPAEQAAVAAAGPAQHDLLANLLWSAKESALKVLETGLRRDTRSVDVEVALTAPASADPGATRAPGWQPLAVRPVEGGVFPGWWQQAGPFLLSVVAEASVPPPACLDVVSPLASAVPTHRWLAAPGG